MKLSHYTPIALITFAVLMLAATASTRAQTVTNTFTNPSLDLVTNGVIDSGFDGADLNFGDVPGANNGGAGNGVTLAANSGASIGAPGSGFLVVQTIDSAWGQGGPGDDGFFAFNIVWGDFSAYLTVAQPFDNANYVFPGLMARAVSDGTGAPYNPTGTNASENWVSITLFEEFGIPTMSEDMTNGTSDQFSNNGTNSLFGSTDSTNANVYLQIKRTGDTFFLYDSADGVSWTLEHTIARPDLHNAAMQVGIEQATYTVNTPLTFFANYGVVGTNTISPAGDPTDIVATNFNTSGSVNLSWTPAAGSEGSVVVLRENKPIIQSPYRGFSYVGNPTNGAVTNMGAQQQVVYAGTGTNVSVSGLSGSNNVYNVAVYSYTTHGGTTPITYDAQPAVSSFNGPGALVSVSFVTAPSAIPVGGVGLAIVTACYTTGDCYDVSSSPDISLSVDNPTVLSITGGVMEGLTNGTANVTATYAGISGTNVVTVHSPVFTDNFDVPHNYLTNGLIGTMWDGEYLKLGDFSGSSIYAGGVAGETLTLDADISNTNSLSLSAAGSSWEGPGDDGPFLFKVVTGDFQAIVQVSNMSTINFNAAGLMARLFDNSGSATQGASGGNGGETHVNWWKVQDGALSARYTLDGNAPTDKPGLNATDTWLLLQRVESTNFYFYEAATPGNWSLAATDIVPEAANAAPMEVGIAEQMQTASTGTAQFASFVLDGTGIVSPTGVQPPPPASGLTMALNNDLSMTLTWISESNGAPIQSMVVMRAGAPVSAQPPYGYLFDSGAQPFGAGSYLGDGNWVVFRSANPPASITNTTVVTGLTPGTTYYAAIYTWTGSSTTKVFDEVIPPTGGSAQLLDGVLTNVIVQPPLSIPAGGIGQLQVLGYYEGGAVVNVSEFANLSSTDTNIADVADGVITGYTPGTATVAVEYAGYTNTVNVVVRLPSHTDDFMTPHDYLTNGVAGTYFDGIYTNYGDIPDQSLAGDGNGATDATLDFDAGITTPGMLTITNYGGGWEFAADDSPFLFKNVLGDFQMAIHINNYSDTVNYTIPSIMARAYSISTNGGAPNTGVTVGAPLDGISTNGVGQECTVRMARFDEYGIGTYPEITIDAASQQLTQPGQGDGENWLLLVRQNYTNFNVYQRSANNQPWHLTPNKTVMSDAKFAGVPMQVGICLSTYSDNAGSYVQFDNFMLDALPLDVSYSGGNVTVSWTQTAATLQSSPSLSPVNWQNVATSPTITNGAATVTMPGGPNDIFFRLTQTPP